MSTEREIRVTPCSRRLRPVTTGVALIWVQAQAGSNTRPQVLREPDIYWVHPTALAISNVKDFEFTGVRLINP